MADLRSAVKHRPPTLGELEGMVRLTIGLCDDFVASHPGFDAAHFLLIAADVELQAIDAVSTFPDCPLVGAPA